MTDINRLTLRRISKLPTLPTPCDGCTRCCEEATIVPLTMAEALNFEHRIHDGVPVLIMTAEGKCPNLRSHGCAAHPAKPVACKTFDCAAVLKFANSDEQALRHMSERVARHAISLLDGGYQPNVPVDYVRFINERSH